MSEKEEKEALLPLPDSKFEYLERKTVKVAQDFSFTFDKVHYTMLRKYLRQELEIRAGEKEIYVYNKNGDLIRTHQRSYTPKSWVVYLPICRQSTEITVIGAFRIFNIRPHG